MEQRRRLQVTYTVERLTTDYEAGLVSMQAATLLREAKWELTLGRLEYAAQKMAEAAERLGRSLDRLADQLDVGH
jgi:hypothetical protein